jgi:hypothetical protein
VQPPAVVLRRRRQPRNQPAAASRPERRTAGLSGSPSLPDNPSTPPAPRHSYSGGSRPVASLASRPQRSTRSSSRSACGSRSRRCHASPLVLDFSRIDQDVRRYGGSSDWKVRYAGAFRIANNREEAATIASSIFRGAADDPTKADARRIRRRVTLPRASRDG